MKLRYFLYTLIIVALNTSCAHQIAFQPTQPNLRYTSGRLAIIPGYARFREIQIIQYINSKKEYLKIGPLHLVPFEEYRASLPYNFTIAGPNGEKTIDSYNTDFNLVDRKKARQLFDTISADYIFVIWAPDTVVPPFNAYGNMNYNARKYLTVFGMLFSREVADKELGVSDLFSTESGLHTFGKNYDEIKNMMANRIIGEILDAMKEELTP